MAITHILVIGDATVDDRLLAGVDNNEGEVDDRVGRRWSVCLLLCLSVPLHQVLKGYLLQTSISIRKQSIRIPDEYLTMVPDSCYGYVFKKHKPNKIVYIQSQFR